MPGTRKIHRVPIRIGIGKLLTSWVVILTALTLAPPVIAVTTDIEGIRVRPSPERTRIVFDLAEPVEHRIFTLSDPHRLVIDIEDASLKTGLDRLKLTNTSSTIQVSVIIW